MRTRGAAPNAVAQGGVAATRTLIAYRFGDFAVFLFGFAKNDRDNVDDRELDDLREAAASWLAADEKLIGQALSPYSM